MATGALQIPLPYSNPFTNGSDQRVQDGFQVLNMNYPQESINVIQNHEQNMSLHLHESSSSPNLSIATGALQSPVSYSNSFTNGSDKRVRDGLLDLNMNYSQQRVNVIHNHDQNVGMNLHESSSSLAITPQGLQNRIFGSNVYDYDNKEGINSNINLNLSLSLTHSPSETQSQGRVSSTRRTIHNVSPRSVVEEQGTQYGITTNNMVLPTKRRFISHTFGEFLEGESSSMSAQAERTTMSNSALNNNRCSYNFARDIQDLLPNQAPLFIRNDTSPLFVSSEVGATNSSYQQLQLAPSFHWVLHESPLTNDMMRARNSPQTTGPYSQIRTEIMAPLHGQRNIQVLSRNIDDNDIAHAQAITSPGQTFENPSTLSLSQGSQEMTPPIVSSNSKIENQHSSVSASANQTNNNFESMFLHQSPFGLEMRRILSVRDDYIHGEEIGKLICKHKFHIGCIKQWLRRKNACPICKQTTLVMDAVRDDAGNEEEHQAIVINDDDDDDEEEEAEEGGNEEEEDNDNDDDDGDDNRD
ncbi:hypothetical protein RJT34_30733 [Clitoria ternatea]|uniref:RING-type domain-containing protein n=1 Tax=Clitoria ternatea TaxID=43366 RepID=A0AAN9F0T1_CLITE